NSMAVSSTTFREDGDRGRPGDPVASGRALARIVANRARTGAEPLTLAAVHPFSRHHYELCHWLEAAGVDPDRDVRLVVVPPPHMVEALSAGSVDVVCVGAPWTVRAVEAGLGRLLMPGAALWPSIPEKVLAVREDRAGRHTEGLAALLRALDRASRWCADPVNRAALAELLAHPDVVGVDAAAIERTLAGTLPVGDGAEPMRVPDFIRWHGEGSGGPINRPRVADGLWFAAQMLRRGQYRDRREAFAAATAAFASELWDRTFGRPETVGTEVVTAFTGPTFVADAPEDRLDAPASVAR
ncbi:MAG: ABC transporter substrate-binding protein, partial [Siculibacillus sp.]|nr:ABC transporter substrate-binding protein [Siculibacillus sp.]